MTDKTNKRFKRDYGSERDRVDPAIAAAEAIREGEFSRREREDFFDGVFSDLMYDYFNEMMKTEPHEVKTREFLYTACRALGDVKNRLIQKETLGKNVPMLTGDKQ